VPSLESEIWGESAFWPVADKSIGGLDHNSTAKSLDEKRGEQNTKPMMAINRKRIEITQIKNLKPLVEHMRQNNSPSTRNLLKSSFISVSHSFRTSTQLAQHQTVLCSASP
jgi:hypothetical protein